MKQAMRITVGLVGLVNLVIGLGFLLAPLRLGARFFVVPIGAQGMATMRADFPAFFITGAAFSLIAARRADPRPLLVPLTLLGLALFGRFVSIALDGTAPTTVQPMVAEAVMLLIVIAARREFTRPSS